MSSATREFAGIPVSGDFHVGYGHVDQLPLEDFLPLFNAVASNPHIRKFGWTQYTPYFNDGEPCEFGAGQSWFLTDADVVNEEELEEEGHWYLGEHYCVSYGSGVLGKSEGYRENKVYERTEDWVVELRAAALALEEAIEGGQFDNVLLDNFGNHVEIIVYTSVSPPYIETATYEHD